MFHSAKVQFLLLLCIVFLNKTPFLSGQTLSFTNDAATWGFLPEWDDYETNSFALEYSRSQWSAELKYRIFTDRNTSDAESGRIDSLLLSSLYHIPIFKAENLQITMQTGLALQILGDFGGYALQGGWHNSVLVERGIPSSYDDASGQILLPIELGMTLPLDFAPYFQTSHRIGWPVEFAGDFRIGVKFPPDILPFDFSFAYGYGIFDTGSQVYDSSMNKQRRLSIHSRLDFWPLVFNRNLFLQERWGSGTMGINFSKPPSRPPENTVMHLNLVGFTHITIGVKVMRELFPGKIYTGVFYKSINGWTDAPYVFPDGGRFSLIQLGLEEGIKLKIGPFRTDLYLLLASGIKQNQFYKLESTLLSPLFVKNAMMFELGGGVRFFIPFFYNRKIGLGFEVSHSWELISGGHWSDSIAGENPVNYLLSLLVSS